MKLGPKLAIAFLLLSLGPLMIFSLISWQFTRAALTDQVHNELRGIAGQQRARLTEFLQRQRERMDLVSSRTQFRISMRDFLEQADAKHQHTMRRILADVIDTVPSYEAFSVLAPDGSIVLDSDDAGAIGIPNGKLEFYKPDQRTRFLEGQPAEYTQRFFRAGDGKLKVYLTSKLVMDGQYLGVVVIHAATDDLLAVLSNERGLGETGEIVLARRDADGDAQFLIPLRFDPNSALNRSVPKEALDTPITQALRKKSDTFTDAVDYRGVPILAATEYLPETDWGLVVKIDKSEAYAPVNRLRNLSLWMMLATGTLVLVVSLGMSRAITRPLRWLTKAAVRIGHGDYSQIHGLTQAPKKANRQDEIGLLSTAFANMSEDLQSTGDELRRNLDELKQAQQTEALLAAIVEYSDDAIIGKTLDGTITSWNRGAERMYGFTAEQAVGQNIDILFPPGRKDEVPKLLRRVAEGNVIDNFHATRLNKSGELLDVSVTISPIKDDQGQVTGASAIARDITKLKRAEAALKHLNESLERTIEKRTARLREANQELEAFSYSVSHDLRAPLRHIGGFVELLQNKSTGQLDETCQRYLDTIATASKRAGQLVDELLAFSRMSRTEIKRQRVDMNALVHDIQHGPLINADGHDICWNVGKLPDVQGDPALLRQVWMNLLSNAVKYTANCAVAEVTVEAVCHETETVFCVRDNGAGFDMQYADKLFGVFQRLHLNDEYEGIGIGLANVERIVQRHGGKTWGEGVPNHGACFYFSLPMNQPTKSNCDDES